MKKIGCLFLIGLLLTGCSAAETFETIGPVQHVQNEVPVMADVELSLPESAVVQTIAGQDAVYECDGYMLLLQTLSSGDFKTTVQTLSGFLPEHLTIIQTGADGIKRYDWVWTAAGEEGDVLGRASVLDDGNYHYCLCVVAPVDQSTALSETWSQLFGSFGIQQ